VAVPLSRPANGDALLFFAPFAASREVASTLLLLNVPGREISF